MFEFAGNLGRPNIRLPSLGPRNGDNRFCPFRGDFQGNQQFISGSFVQRSREPENQQVKQVGFHWGAAILLRNPMAVAVRLDPFQVPLVSEVDLCYGLKLARKKYASEPRGKGKITLRDPFRGLTPPSLRFWRRSKLFQSELQDNFQAQGLQLRALEHRPRSPPACTCPSRYQWCFALSFSPSLWLFSGP